MKLNELMEKYGDYEVKEGFMDLLEKPKPKTVWDLKGGDEYYLLSSCGNVTRSVWFNIDTDKERLNIGNGFLTKEDAKFARECLKVIAELKRYAKEFSDEEWRDADIPKYYIAYNYSINDLRESISGTLKVSNIYFESREKAQEAIKAVGEDRVKKYYFGVKG